MYCMKFRKSSSGPEYGRKSGRKSDFYRKLEKHSQFQRQNHDDASDLPEEQPQDHEVISCVSDNNINSNTRETKVQNQHQHFHEEQKEVMGEYSATMIKNNVMKSKRSPQKNRYSIASEMISRFEKEISQQETESATDSSVTNGTYPTTRKSNSKMRKETKFEKDLKKIQQTAGMRRQNTVIDEEKKDDSSSKFDELDHLVSQIPQSGERLPQSSSPTSVVRNDLDDDSPLSKETLFSDSVSSELKLRNELKKTCHMLDMERNKNMALLYRLKDRETQLKQINNSHSKELIFEEYDRQIQKLQNEVEYYRGKFEREEERRLDIEDELDDIREENKKYGEQMDTLIFQHIPSVAPVFKDIGSVNYTIDESFDTVASYRLGDVLGEGHYGSVRIGSHAQKQQKFAIKILNKNNIKRFKDLKQIATEVSVLQRYRHPNIIHLEEVVHASDNIYMVTELCYMDLHKYHNHVGLTIDSAREVILGVLHPLNYLHFNGICHLDLKPENILLTRSLESHNAMHQHVRLCDFGLVNMARKSDKNKDIIREGYACGTPGFYAPEMMLKDRFEGRTADMWSLGCIILEITLGFTQDWIDSYDKVDDDPLAFQTGLEFCLDELSVEQYPEHECLLDVLHRCLSIDPSIRITSKDTLEHPWLETRRTKSNSDNGATPYRDTHQNREEMTRSLFECYPSDGHFSTIKRDFAYE